MVSSLKAPFRLTSKSGEIMQMRIVGTSETEAEIVGCRWMPLAQKNQWTCVTSMAQKAIRAWHEEPFLSVPNTKMLIVQKRSGTQYIRGNAMTMTGTRQYKQGIEWKLG